jgi:EF-P beta-lysylation protein EpmB
MQKWQKKLNNNFKKIDDLINFLKIDPSKAKTILKNGPFPLNLPMRLAQKIKKNDLFDPIFLQFVPLLKEEKKLKGFCQDPTDDKKFQKNKLLKKYSNRALLLCSPTCAMHCRFCFRKNFPFENHSSFFKELEEIKKDSNLKEILLSGGDPLMLSNNILKKLLLEIDEMPHVQRIRFHTRMPIGIPERIDDEFLKILKSVKKQIIFVLHINHKNEFLDKDVILSLKKIRGLKIPILSQTVLLKNVNDDITSLLELNETLSSNGIIPYYLHQLDRVDGSGHFEVKIKKGLELIKQLQELTSGYNVFRYVKEIPHKKSKTILG